MQDRKIIIGATGFVGKRLLACASKIGKSFGTSSKGGEHQKLDLKNLTKNDLGFINSNDVLFITAAISSPDICSKDPKLAWAVNVDGTSRLIEYAMEIGARVIFFSSDTVYGERFDDFDESSDIAPLGIYALMKSEIERKFLNVAEFKSIRLSYVFSSEDKFTQYVINTHRKGEEVDVFDSLARSVIYLEDVVQGVLNLSQNWYKIDNKIINFGGDNLYTRADMAQILKDAYLSDLKIRKIIPDAKFFESRPRVINMKSPILEKLLGCRPFKLSDAVIREFEINEGI